MVSALTKPLTFEDFVAQYGDDPRYELIDGELRDLEPTGPHQAIAGHLIAYLSAAILQHAHKWVIPKSCLIKPPAAEATALKPDIIVLDRSALQNEPLWQRKPIITSGQAIRFIAEIVSTNWQDDYARKIEEYALLRVPEYWVVEHYRGLGGIDYIGSPKQPAVTVCNLKGDRYVRQRYWTEQTIQSAMFPDLHITLRESMAAIADA
ncbi:MAG: Uma2 family endonuclease [Cyanobacteria bacterium J06638_28]